VRHLDASHGYQSSASLEPDDGIKRIVFDGGPTTCGRWCPDQPARSLEVMSHGARGYTFSISSAMAFAS